MPAKKKLPAKPKATAASQKNKLTAIKSKIKLTKQQEVEARKAHDLYWNSYIVGDIETLASLLDDRYTQIGSVESEVFFNKKDAVKFVSNTIDQVAGNVEMRHRITKADSVDGFILFNEQCDLYVLIEGVWTFYSKFRASSLMQKIGESWQMIHQHSSIPDSKAQDGENIATEKIAAENLQLRDAIKRRTVELEQKNRELEIEAAMEKVRVRSLAMQKPEELADVAEVLRKEMGSLGVEELETSSIYIVDDATGTSECWYAIKDIRGKNKKLVTDHMTLRLDETWVGRQMKKFYGSKETRASIEMKGENRKEWINHCAGKSSVLKGYYGGEIPDRTYHLLKFSNGFMGAASPGEISTESWDLLQRATAVFSFAYKRFSDLQKAEAQAREAQIEAALERVRSRSLAMHKSEELVEVATVLYKELRNLDVREFSVADIVIFDESKNEQIVWGARTESDYLEKAVFPLLGDQILQKLYDLWSQKETFFTVKVGGSALKKHCDFVFPIANRTELEAKVIENMPDPTFFHCAYFAMGYLELVADKELSEGSSIILTRFAKVFEQTYTRFLDLQKAEAQAREAKIEAALERVRSRSMTMHQTSELHEVSMVLYDELRKLGFQFVSCGFTIVLEEEQVHDVWNYDFNRVQLTHFQMLLQGDNTLKERYQAWKSKKTIFLQELKGKALEKHLRITSPEELKREKNLVSLFNFPDPAYFCFANFSKGYLHVIGNSQMQIDHQNILPRFAKVFEQTYTRFLDLQKAEAQAREAQIEAALERVRARTMAMQKPDELLEVGGLLYKELSKLGVSSLTSGYTLVDKDGKIDWNYVASPEDGSIASKPLGAPRDETKVMRSMTVSWEKQEPFHVIELNPQETIKHQTYIAKNLINFPITAEQLISVTPERLVLQTFNFEQGYLLIVGAEKLSDENVKMIVRFARVFEMTYKRFLDLQKAEAQAREAQIETSLERVRSRSLAMQKSEELNIVLATIFKEVSSLGLRLARGIIWIFHPQDKSVTWWASNPEAESGAASYHIPYLDHTVYRDIWQAWEERTKKYVYDLSGETKRSWDEILFTSTELAQLPKEAKAGMKARKKVYLHISFNEFGLLMLSAPEPLDEDSISIIDRFGRVFEQSYTRFNDIKQAEAQVREAEIQLALERVRARTMAMHKSEELPEVVFGLFEQMHQLGFAQWGGAIALADETKGGFDIWFSTPANRVSADHYFFPNHGHAVSEKIWDIYQKQIELFIIELKDDEKAGYTKWLFNATPLGNMPENDKAEILSERYVMFSFSAMKYGLIEAISHVPMPTELAKILPRFAKVFEQTYTRFLDLQKAEAQAREAQIQLALERVRARTMAMHKSEELQDVVVVLYDQLEPLGLADSGCELILIDEENQLLEYWHTNPVQPMQPTRYRIPKTTHPFFEKQWSAWAAGTDGLIIKQEGEAKREFERVLFERTAFDKTPEETKEWIMSEDLAVFSHVTMKYGLLEAVGHEEVSNENFQILKRFAKVFEQTYTRFLDLQKAEAQARESQIEAALERVRSRSMGMQKSEELRDVIQVIYEQFLQLNIPIDGAGFAMDYVENDDFNFWLADATSAFPYRVHIPYSDHPQFNRYKEAKEKGLDFYTSSLTPEERNRFFDHISKYIPIPQELKEVVYSAPGYETSHVVLKNVILYILNFSGHPFSDANNATLKRFGKVFEQTYTRFNDLKQAEAQAIETTKRASVDRIRAEIASMRTTKDLERITPLIWSELTTLGVPFIRCGVFIMDEESQLIHNYLSTPQGKSIAAFHLPYNTPGFFAKALKHWQEKKIYIDHLDKAAFAEIANTLVQQGAFTSQEQYLNTLPHSDLHAHFLPFLQGMLYVANTSPLAEQEINLVQSLADAFSTAYARYEDFNKLEAAKQQVDKTLVDLKQTQAQLVQSEKMASLGELTAGIAHEIQNPLNFVNNFSEVNTELIDELKNELAVGNRQSAEELVNDIKSNSEKINHHGKRAGDIVKGMLQHSRSSSGVKEPTDINALADEYLRLAYHGLRAKDKSFNATMKTDFDESIGHINIIPQDIGRVILNLITNAFYTVTERKKQQPDARPDDQVGRGYEPEVIVSTKKLEDKVLVSVKDNGNGIPQKVLDKIFQPFFTTKPTGQGTGLGLSLSYDIVKAHGGELRVETKEGEGSEFLIVLSV